MSVAMEMVQLRLHLIVMIDVEREEKKTELVHPFPL
jgi:hypothetical protein